MTRWSCRMFALGLGLGVALWSASVQAAEPVPLIRAHLDAAQVAVGQPLRLTVDVLVPTWFTSPLDYPATLELEGVTAQLASQGGGNLSERINGVAYAGMTRDYQLVAHHAGRFTVPAITLRVTYAQSAQTRSVTLSTRPQTFVASLPRGMEDLGYFIATRDYRLHQSTDRSLAGLKVGDALIRRIIQHAEGVPAMELPALAARPIAGLAVYAGEPGLIDGGGERGSVTTGERTDTLTYILQMPGNYRLPGFRIGWFDPVARRLRWSKVPPLTFVVAANPAYRSPPPAAVPQQKAAPRFALPESAALARWTGLLLLLLFSVGVGQRLRPRLGQSWRALGQRYRQSEAGAFRRCSSALGHANPAQALHGTMAWLNCVPAYSGVPVTRFAADYGDEALRHGLDAIHRALFSPSAQAVPWDARAYRQALGRARRRWRLAQRRQRREASGLTMLNPPG